MDLPANASSSSPSRRPGVVDGLVAWNRRIHFYLGLYLLFFTWLFAFTGLLLNHPEWRFAEFWPNRRQTVAERTLVLPAGASDEESARRLMEELDVLGEIQWPAAQRDGALAFQVGRPGVTIDVKADLASGRTTVQRTELNRWGVMHILHTFTGVRPGDNRNGRDWRMTTLWAISMDAVAGGLIAVVLTSYVMWFRLKSKRRGGYVALLLGGLTCLAVLGAGVWPG
jgi:hypothetical protein